MIKRQANTPDIATHLKRPINNLDLDWLLTAEQKTTVFYSVI
jgi:hypothetical protein